MDLPSAKISIITPCYNSAAYINEAIKSVLKQTYTNFELILVNDGSTDKTEELILSFKDKRIRYFKQPNKGQCVASNFGLSAANGDYIKFFDADDLMNEVHLEEQLKRIDGREDVLASCSWGRFYDGNPGSAKFIPETVWKDLDSVSWIKNALSQQYDMMGAWVWLIPKKVIERSGGWDERLSLNNDFEFSMRLLSNVKQVFFAEKAKLYYRSGISSLSQRPSVKAFSEAILATDLGCSYLLSREDSVFTRRLCADRYKEWLFRIYPSDKKLESLVEKKIESLGGSKRKMDGGVIFKILQALIGWKLAKKIKMLFAR